MLGPDLVLLDVYFPDGSGIDLLRQIRELHQQTDVILITAAKEVDTLQEAIHGGVFDFIVKPLGFRRFEDSLKRFRSHKYAMSRTDSLEQRTVDRIMHSIHGPSTPQSDELLPKGIDGLTLDKVHTLLDSMDDDGVSAEQLAIMLGTSRTTARRYLEFMVSRGLRHPTLNYGSVGRPERWYMRAKGNPRPASDDSTASKPNK